MNKNTTPAILNESDDGKKELPQEELLKNESDILESLLAFGNEEQKLSNYRVFKIKRGGHTLAFRVRPVTEQENRKCWKKATPTQTNKKINVETDIVKYRSLLIYTATVDEDRVKIWDNQAAKDALDVYESWEMIDKVLYAGEKARVIDLIDEISEGEGNAEEAAKN